MNHLCKICGDPLYYQYANICSDCRNSVVELKSLHERILNQTKERKIRIAREAYEEALKKYNESTNNEAM